ncbi:MAG: class I SAM-dependent methyltransferase [Thaumarchaeota archaeon]|nr:class I SAM-dependent methyltransferase [Nitrososphaerota archaeon]
MSFVPFIESPIEVVRRMLQLAKVGEEDLVYDLGSGDGRTVITSCSEFGAQAVGVELRADLVKRSTDEIRRLELTGRGKIIQTDFFNFDLSNATVIILYLNTSTNSRLKPKLEKELRDGTRVVSHDFEITGWKPLVVSRDNPLGHSIYLYKLPESVVGPEGSSPSNPSSLL